ncbi:MAG: primosomal protein N', partial [Syntrophomonadaceae bacterium]|nr:primosomal protein N' [Syntrophomonadaceae bacterium]
PDAGRQAQRVRGVMEALWEEGEMSLARARRLAGEGGWLHVLEEAGLLVHAGAPGMRRRSLAGDVYALADAAAARDMLETWRRRAPRQAEVVDLLLQQGEVAAEALEKAAARASLQALVSRGVVIRRGRGSGESPPLPLTAEQGEAIAHLCRRLEAREPATVLLFGITGSGKTEVYLRAIEHARSLGLQSVVLVPEIALTEHMVDVYAQRLGKGLSVLHSRQSDGERHETWQRIRRGEVDVVLGPRSAVFAPFPRPGLFVVDEEHEHSYKQDTVPRYHAREVAERRAGEHRALVVLGSATPSLETFYRARSGLIQHLHLAQRAGGQPPPRVEVVDMREEFRQGNRTIFSRLLRDRLAQCLQRGEQAILFLNRRGYFTHLACRECGLVVTCPHCAIPLAYHQQGEHLRCHYCGLVRREVPARCPRCGSG